VVCAVSRLALLAGEELKNRLRQLPFENRQMTQRQLAEEVGITRQTVITIEASRYSPSLKLVFRIAGAFGVSMGDVFQYSAPSADPATCERDKPSTAEVNRPETSVGLQQSSGTPR
jgi:putative transcriptional regulator